MRVVLSGGGTAGHINPALALAEELSARGHEVLFAGTPEGLEARLVAQAGIPFTPFKASGFDREAPLTLVTSTFKILASALKAGSWFKKVKPDAVVGFGGYVSIPVGVATVKRRIPLVIHEQNSVMGMANKFLSEFARYVAVTYQVAGKDVDEASKVFLTGNPVRSSVLAVTRQEGRRMLGIPEDGVMLLAFGGSLGARHINQALCALKQRLLEVDNLYVVHISGPREYDTVKADLDLSPAEAQRWILMPYQDRMAETLAAADCVLSRAGATSLAEISALGLPALLVPFPYATEDHQTTNAQAYVASGAAEMIADANLDSPEFAQLLMTLVTSEQERERMRQAAASFETQNAAARLADLVIQAAEGK